MSRLLAAEVLKLRTTRTFLVFVLAALALSLLVSILTAALTDSPTGEDAASAAYADLSSVFILLLAIVATTGEWRHRTIAGTVLAAPDRVRLIVAKALAYAGAGVALSLLVSICTYVAALLILSSRGEVTPDFGDWLDLVWRSLVFAAYVGALGVGIGAIVRNQPAAIVIVLVAALAVEPALSGLAPDVWRFAPLTGAPSGLFGGTVEEADDTLARGVALLVMAAWVAGSCAAAIALLRGRDLD